MFMEYIWNFYGDYYKYWYLFLNLWYIFGEFIKNMNEKAGAIAHSFRNETKGSEGSSLICGNKSK